MAAKRYLIPSALLLALSLLTGCRGFCERHYPCPAPQTACVPCCPAGSGYAQVPPPPPQPVNFGSSGRMSCECTPIR